MTLYAVVDDEELGQVATIKGWGDFIEWAEQQWRQDPQFRELAHLAVHGYATKLKDLADQIDAAISKSNPREDIESTARGIEDIARAYPDAEILIVTDGTGGDYDDDDDESDDDDS